MSEVVLWENNKPPFLTRVIALSKKEGLLNSEELSTLKSRAAMMTVKFADKYYNQFKYHSLERAAQDIVGVSSIGLVALSNHDEKKAAALLQDPNGIVTAFQKGWTMLNKIWTSPFGVSSIYQDVDERLLDQISTPAGADDWPGWQCYQTEEFSYHRSQVVCTLWRTFFDDIVLRNCNIQMQMSSLYNAEEVLAQVLVYAIVLGEPKVTGALKHHVAFGNRAYHDFSKADIEEKLGQLLSLLPAEISEVIRVDMTESFITQIQQTLQFCKLYKENVDKGLSFVNMLDFEEDYLVCHNLLGWPSDA